MKKVRMKKILMKKILMKKIRYRILGYNDDFKRFMTYKTHTIELIFKEYKIFFISIFSIYKTDK